MSQLEVPRQDASPPTSKGHRAENVLYISCDSHETTRLLLPLQKPNHVFLPPNPAMCYLPARCSHLAPFHPSTRPSLSQNPARHKSPDSLVQAQERGALTLGTADIWNQITLR